MRSYSLTVFSPSGKLVQIEHALAAVSQGTTSLGIKGALSRSPSLRHPWDLNSNGIGMRCAASNGIVIATEKKSSSILIDDSMLDKVAVICPNIGIVYSGMGPDFRVLIAKARKSAQAYWKIYGEYPPTRVLTQEIATVMQQATQSGSAALCSAQLCIVLMLIPNRQRCPTIWRFSTCRGLGHAQRPKSLPGRSGWLFLGVESKRDREEHG